MMSRGNNMVKQRLLMFHSWYHGGQTFKRDLRISNTEYISSPHPVHLYLVTQLNKNHYLQMHSLDISLGS